MTEELVEHINAIQNELIDEAIAALLEYIQFDYPLYPMLNDEDDGRHLQEMPASLNSYGIVNRCR